MKAVILAAGEGERLRPLTLTTPKPLLPIGDRPLIEHTIAWLRRYGVDKVFINLHHLGERIEEHLEDGRDLPLPNISMNRLSSSTGMSSLISTLTPFALITSGKGE